MDSGPRLSLSQLSSSTIPGLTATPLRATTTAAAATATTGSFASPGPSVVTAVGFHQPLALNGNVLDCRLALADEHSVSVLQDKVAQVHGLRLEMQRRDDVLADLQRQVAELLPLKEEVQQWKMELWLAEERLRLKEAELRSQYAELQAAAERARALEVDVAGQAKRREEADALEQAQQEKLEDLQRRVHTLDASARRLEAANALLARQREEAEAALRAEERRCDEREQRLEEQVADLQQELQTARQRAAAAEHVKAQVDRELQDTMRLLERSKEDAEATELQCMRLMSQVTALTDANRQLADTVAMLREDAAEVHRLRQDMSAAASLQGSLDHSQAQVRELEGQLQRAQAALLQQGQEVQRWRQEATDGQAQVEAQSREASEQLKAELWAVRGDLEASRLVVTRLSQELRQTAAAQKEEEMTHDVALQELQAEFLQLHRLLDGVLEGRPVPSEAEPRLTTEHTAGLQALLLSFRGRLADAATQWASAREQQRLLQQSVDTQQLISAALDEEKLKLYSECLALRAQLEKGSAAEGALREEAGRLADRCGRLEAETGRLTAQLAEVVEGATVVVRRLADQLATLDIIAGADP
eukprot:EG_transcript_7448